MDKTLSDVVKREQESPLEEEYYEKLYKIEGVPGKVFRFISSDRDSILFAPFSKEDGRYWIENNPKKVRML